MSTGRLSESVGRVESELAAFWSAPDTSKGAPVAKVRAATMNLAVVSSAAEVDRVRAASEAVSETHAGRTFLLSLDGRLAPWDVESKIGAVCRMDGGVPLCYDRVEMTFGAMAAGRAASVVSTLSLSEVPTVVEVAMGAPSMLVDGLAKRCDRLIVDSAHTSFSRIADVSRLTRAGIGDRAFVRTYSWRELTARFFDQAPRAARSIRRVEVGRTAGGKVDPAALIVGWLASRLGWTFESAVRAAAPGGGSVEIVLRTDDRTDVAPGQLTSIRIAAEFDGARLDLECGRTAEPGVVRWVSDGAITLAHEHRLGHHDENWVLIKALDSTESDAVYREAALAAAEWSSR